MNSGRNVDWGDRPTEIRARPKTAPSLAVALPAVPAPGLGARIRRLWYVWIAVALVGGIGGAFAAPFVLRKSSTPERLRSKAAATEAEQKPALETDGRTFETENTRIQFRKSDKPSKNVGGGPGPNDPEAPLY